jgi:hypothetical protein
MIKHIILLLILSVTTTFGFARMDTASFIFQDSYSNKVKAYSAATGTWASVTYQCNDDQISWIKSYGGYAFKDSYSNKVYAYSIITGSWASVKYHANDD